MKTNRFGRRPGPGVLLTAVAILLAGTAVMGQDSFLLRDGRTVQGRLIGDDGRRIQVRLPVEGGGVAIQTIPYEDLAARTVYRLRLGRPEARTAEGQIGLAEFALTSGLFDAARRHFGRAALLEPAREDEAAAGLARVQAAAAAALLDSARRKAAGQDPLAAEKDLALLLKEFPDEPAAEDGRALYASLAPAREAAEKRALAEAVSRAEKARQEAVAPATKLHARGVEHVTKGLLATRNRGEAAQHFQEALRACEEARVLLDRVSRENGRAPEMSRLVSQLDGEIRSHILDTDLHLASLYLVRQTPREALAWANRALALDPGNRDALAMRARIESSIQSGSRVGWGKRISH